MHTILYPAIGLYHAGAEQQLYALVRGLDKRRFRPIVAPLYPGGVLAESFRATPGVEVIDLNRRGKFDYAPLWRVAALLRARRVDLVQPFLTPATFFGLLPAWLVGTPVKVVTERCGVRHERQFGHRLYQHSEDWLTRFADAVVPNSRAGRESLLARGIPDEKIRVIYNGVNPERLQVDPAARAAHRERLGVPAGGQVVGILASLTEAKDHATFLRAAALVSVRRPDVRYAIVGGGPVQAELEALAAGLGLADRVVFCGYQRQVASCLAAWDLLVSASRDNEGLSNSILEAMALGVPVVATAIGGTPELVEDGVTGALTAAGDPAALAAAIEAALADPAAARARAARARQLVESRFSLERMVADYEGLYERLLEAKERAAVPSLAVRGADRGKR
ncbi:MAG TPA: glycosyltransferase [Thermomicrobiales bacterium]|nr:glycosyltransferase [Thermomicrobiales bacterium]